MKKILRNNIYIGFCLLFVVLLFQNNVAFKKCILNGCQVFLESVFPSLFPMFIVQDILLNYHFFILLDFFVNKIFKKIFHMSSAATYTFIMSIFSGTPTNAYLATNLVKEKKLLPKDAGIILCYSCFLNPLFLYNMLLAIFHNKGIAFKLIFINYSLNFFIAFLLRKYKYQEIDLHHKSTNLTFTKVLSQSIERSFKTFIIILGTIIFYFMICEGINIIFHHPIFNCIVNGLLETTGGLAKLTLLNVSMHFKEVLASFFISFGGLSIHTQIKNIIMESSIPYKYFFLARTFHAILSAVICIVIP